MKFNILDNIIEEKKKFKEYIQENNQYGRYSKTQGWESANLKSVEEEVDTQRQALQILERKDFRELFGIKGELEEPFECCMGNDIIYKKVVAFDSSEREEKEREYSGWEKIEERVNLCGHYVLSFKKNEGYKSAKAKVVKEKGRYRYYRQCMFDEGREEYRGWGIVDLYEILNKCDYSTAVKELCKIYNIKIRIYGGEEEACQSNIEVLSDEETLRKTYPTLYKIYLNKHVDKLIAFMQIYTTKIGKGTGNGLRVSSKEIGEKLGIKKHTVVPLLNVFVMIGLIRRTDMILRRIGEQDKPEYYYKVDTYSPELLQYAEDKVKEIKIGINRLKKEKPNLKNRLSPSQMTCEICAEIFGEEVAKKVYYIKGDNNEGKKGI